MAPAPSGVEAWYRTLSSRATSRDLHRAVVILALPLLTACHRPDDRAEIARRMEHDTVPVLVGAGDIADCVHGADLTATLLDTIRGTVFVAGDAGYTSKRILNPLITCFDQTWGRHAARIRPSPGNHDYADGGPARYFDYFGDRAGPRSLGYYSFELGTWHVISLNSVESIEADSPQDRWLHSDLAAHLGRCTVAFMHHPRFSSGPHEERERMIPLWTTLARHGVSVVIAGHDHIYERFQPLDADGRPDDEGTRQFVVGTGGASRYAIQRLLPGSEAQSDDSYGVLKLSLLPNTYRWEFVPVVRAGYQDRGESTCHPTHVPR